MSTTQTFGHCPINRPILGLHFQVRFIQLLDCDQTADLSYLHARGLASHGHAVVYR